MTLGDETEGLDVMSDDTGQRDAGNGQLNDGGIKALEAERRARREAEQRARQAETQVIALRHGVPPELLEGVAADQLEARAQALVAFRGDQGGQDGGQGDQGGAPAGQGDQNGQGGASGADGSAQGGQDGGIPADRGRSRPRELRPGASPGADSAESAASIAAKVWDS